MTIVTLAAAQPRARAPQAAQDAIDARREATLLDLYRRLDSGAALLVLELAERLLGEQRVLIPPDAET